MCVSRLGKRRRFTGSFGFVMKFLLPFFLFVKRLIVADVMTSPVTSDSTDDGIFLTLMNCVQIDMPLTCLPRLVLISSCRNVMNCRLAIDCGRSSFVSWIRGKFLHFILIALLR